MQPDSFYSIYMILREASRLNLGAEGHAYAQIYFMGMVQACRKECINAYDF